MPESTYVFKLLLPKKVKMNARSLDREDFFAWLWESFATRGLLGVHEGTMLCDDAAEQGLETESWTVDAAEAPRERDWMQNQDIGKAQLYFASRAEAESAHVELEAITGIKAEVVTEQQDEDWNATWKASFNALEKGFEIPPFWKIYPSWIEKQSREGDRHVIRINPGAGFGTGTHETTQLCLQAIGDTSFKMKFDRALDFGSGSGILAIGAALLDANVSAVEIDPLAIDNGIDNAKFNSVESKIQYTKTLGSVGNQFPLVIANILRPVLVEFAPELVGRLAPGGVLILSGLIETDVPEIDRVFSKLIGKVPEQRSLNEWRCLLWKR